jgi:MFS superfamily sulfate permease-like transporter
VTSADSLVELLDSLEANGIAFYFAEMKDPVKDKMKRFGVFDHMGEGHFFPTIESAVADHSAATKLAARKSAIGGDALRVTPDSVPSPAT